MTKRRSSIRGRGAEILLGDPQPVDIQPLGPDLPLVGDVPLFDDAELAQALAEEARAAEPEAAPAPEPEPEAEAVFDDAELARALAEEARAGEPEAEGEIEDLSALDPEPVPAAEIDKAFFEEALGAEEPPEPVAETPTPTLEATMEEQERMEEAAMNQPPPPETVSVAEDLLPARPAPPGFGMEGADFTLRDVQDSGRQVDRFELPERALTEEEQKQLLRRLGSAWIQQLSDEISKTYDQVLSKVGENEDITNDCFNQLLKARDIVLRRDAARIPQAEYYLEQVRARLKRAVESEAKAHKYAWWIFGWGAFWGLILIAVLIFLNYEWFQDAIIPPATTKTLVDMDIFLSAMLWGGVGGVAAVWYSLFKHVGLRDFDSQYNLSYFGKPFLGLVLGATVYMIFNLLIRTLGILPAGLEGQQLSAPAVAPGVIYLMAWACGFKENRIFDLIDRVMKRIFSGEEETPPPPPATPTPPAEPLAPVS